MNPLMILPGPKVCGILKAVINQSGDLKQAGGCSYVAFFHSYVCHNKRGNRIICACGFCLVTKQALLLTTCVFCEILNIEKWSN